MAAYVFATLHSVDAEYLSSYTEQLTGTAEPFGGSCCARVGQRQRLTQFFEPRRIVILEFPDVERAKQWSDSEGYGELRELRRGVASTTMIVVDALTAFLLRNRV